MPPAEVDAVRAVSAQPMKTRWMPVDLVCCLGEQELTIRAKLARNDESMAVCIAEAVSHAFLKACGFRMAEPYCVVIGHEFAQDLTTQCGFEEAIRPGRHWGTGIVRRAVAFDANALDALADPRALFYLYLADVILGNPDRSVPGNALLARQESDPRRLDVIPIDRSDAFFHPSSMLDARVLRAGFDLPRGQMLAGTEGVLLDNGPILVETCFGEMGALRDRVADFVAAGHDEWYE